MTVLRRLLALVVLSAACIPVVPPARGSGRFDVVSAIDGTPRSQPIALAPPVSGSRVDASSVPFAVLPGTDAATAGPHLRRIAVVDGAERSRRLPVSSRPRSPPLPF